MDGMGEGEGLTVVGAGAEEDGGGVGGGGGGGWGDEDHVAVAAAGAGAGEGVLGSRHVERYGAGREMVVPAGLGKIGFEVCCSSCGGFGGRGPHHCYVVTLSWWANVIPLRWRFHGVNKVSDV